LNGIISFVKRKQNGVQDDALIRDAKRCQVSLKFKWRLCNDTQCCTCFLSV